MHELSKITVTNVDAALLVNFPKGVTNKMFNRETYGLSFCIEGQVTYNHNGKKVVSTPENAIILPQGQTYSIHGDKGGVFIVINFRSPDLRCDTITSFPIKSVQPYNADFEKMKALFLFEKNRAKIMSIFYDMLHRLVSDLAPSSAILSPALKYLEEKCFSSDLSISTLANVCNISEVYFRKLFIQQYGISPKQYIIDVRIEKARQLLTDGRLKIGAVSEECGFTNPYHFSRQFKNKTGLTPTEYMKQNKIYKI